MWFIFPQIKGLGRSYNAAYYAIRSMEEAEAYLADPVLGKRLREITETVLSHKEDDIRTIMGCGIDTMKFRSSMTLFDRVCPCDIFAEAINTFFSDQRDGKTRLTSTIPWEATYISAKLPHGQPHFRPFCGRSR